MTGAPTPSPVPDFGTGPPPEPSIPVELLPNLRRLTAPNPGLMTGPGTNTYLVGRGEVAIVDPGPESAEHLQAILGALDEHHERVTTVLVTHTHPDHAPGAAALAERTGAELVGFGARDGFVPDRTAAEGTVVGGPTYSLRAVHTPGHASNHLCWRTEDTGVLLSGDHVMHGATVVIRPPDGDVAQYLASLRRLPGLDLSAIAPGHGRLLSDPVAVAEATVAHRLARETIVAAALVAARRATVDDLVPGVYADVAEPLLPVARLSLWAHLRKLESDGRALADRQSLPAAPGPDGEDPELSVVWEATATTAP